MIQSVDRAARILRALAAGSGRLGVSELSDRLGLAKGTVHGLLRTLHDHGLVEQDADSDKYQLGPQLLQLSNRYLDLNELRARSLAWSELLATRAGEAVRVGVPHRVSHALLRDAQGRLLNGGLPDEVLELAYLETQLIKLVVMERLKGGELRLLAPFVGPGLLGLPRSPFSFCGYESSWPGSRLTEASMPSMSSCNHLEPVVFVMAGVASGTESYPGAPRGWPH